MTTITIDSDVFAQHIHSLIEVMRMPNTEHVADAHNKAVRFLRAALAAQQPAPAWHDAPTEPGDWILSTACGLEVHQGIKQHELDNGELWPGSRWFGPIPEYQK